MEKKFKEYRMFWICFMMFIVFIAVTLFCMIQGHIMQAVGAILLSMIALILLAFRYKMILFDDMMMIYEWKVVAMLPTVIEYKDIQSLEKKSKHHVIIQHHHSSHIYVFDSDEFINTYNQFQNKA